MIYCKNTDKSLDECRRAKANVGRSQRNIDLDECKGVTRRV